MFSNIINLVKSINCVLIIHCLFIITNGQKDPNSYLIQNMYKFNIYVLEEQPINHEICNLNLLLNLSQLNQISINLFNQTKHFQIFNSDPYSQLFYLEPELGILKIAKRLDRDQLCLTNKITCCQLNELHLPNVNYFNLLHNHTDKFNLKINEDKHLFKIKDNKVQKKTKCHLDLFIRIDNQYSNIITLHIYIIDINDNAPMWIINSNTNNNFIHSSTILYEKKVS